jgi:hypothetical protein
MDSSGNFATNIGQDQSCQQPTLKVESSSLQCFHRTGGTDADLSLLREKNVWIGEDLATQSQEEAALPANLSSTNQFSHYAAYEDRNFYCENCCQKGWSKLSIAGFPTRCIQRDSHMVRPYEILDPLLSH